MGEYKPLFSDNSIKQILDILLEWNRLYNDSTKTT